jgi:hypothetical protein
MPAGWRELDRAAALKKYRYAFIVDVGALVRLHTQNMQRFSIAVEHLDGNPAQ